MMYGKFYGQEHVPYPDDPEVLKSPEEKQADQLKQLKNDLLITLSTTIIYGLLILMFFQNGMLILGTSVYGAEIFLLFYVACPIFSVIAIVYFLFIGRRYPKFSIKILSNALSQGKYFSYKVNALSKIFANCS